MINNPQVSISLILNAFKDHVRESKNSPFGDKRNKPNSIVDAEMLLVLLLPHSTIRGQYDLGNSKSADVKLAKILNEMIGEKDVQGKLLVGKVNDKIVELLLAFFNNYSIIKDESNIPNFNIGTYAEYSDNREMLTPDDQQIEIVDSYAMSLTLCIYVLRLLDSWVDKKDDDNPVPQWLELEKIASERLTGSMRGLLASFTVKTFNQGDWNNKTNREWDKIKNLAPVRDRLRRLGLKKNNLPLDMAFECGWSWGPVGEDQYIVPHADDPEEIIQWKKRVSPYTKPKRLAVPAPYLYFTVMALDSIADLNDSDVMSGSILNPEQLVLADRLRSLAQVTSMYWSEIAFGDGKELTWPIEEIPWKTTDGEGSDYWTLYVLRMLGDKLPEGDTGVGRVLDLLEELAQRSRITRKPYPPKSDKAIEEIHAKGYSLLLDKGDSTDSQSSKHRPICYPIFDFAPQLMKQVAQLLKLQLTDNHRTRVTSLLTSLWEHLSARSSGGRELYWDFPENVYKDYYDNNVACKAAEEIAGRKKDKPSTFDDKKVGSWYFTERVMEALIARVQGEKTRPKSSEQLRSIAAAALAEAVWMAGRQTDQSEDDKKSIEDKLSKARENFDDNPLMALSIAVEIGGNWLKLKLTPNPK